MPTINLATKYASQIQQKFTTGSLVQGRVENDVDFVGAKTVRIHTIHTVPMNDYDRNAKTHRYGTPQEVGDQIQELTMTQDKGFAAMIDKGNSVDQTIHKAGEFTRVQIEEAVIPGKDAHALMVIAHEAGTIADGTEGITKDNVITRMNTARSAFLNHHVPVRGRTWFVRSEVFDALVHSDHFRTLNDLGSQTLCNGQMGEIFGAPVVEVPGDIMPPGVNFILLHKSAAACPAKISDTKVHVDPPGLSGHLVEGRFYYDTFVFGAKASGIYVDLTTGDGVTRAAAPTLTAAGNMAGSVPAGYQAWGTADGSDPRYGAGATRSGNMNAHSEVGDTVKVCFKPREDDPLLYASKVASVVRSE